MKLTVIKTPHGDLRPATETDKDAVRKWRPGDIVELEARRPRSGDLHRFYFALLRMVYENSQWAQDRWPTFDRWREAVQMQAGHFEETVSINGTVMFRPKSVAYHKMDQDEFLELIAVVKQIIIKHVWPHITADELDRMTHEFMMQEIVA